MTEPGQTDNYTLSEHIKAIHEHAGKGIVDYCIYDTGEIVPEFIRRYNKEGADLVEQDTAKAKEEGIKLIQRNLSYIDSEFIRHNPDAIASSIIELICEDLKFRDMQNDAQYLLLNSRLKSTKKQLKTTMKKNVKKDNKKEKNKTRSKSKFAEKYSDRIESIKESDEKALKRKQAKIKEKETKNKKVASKKNSTVGKEESVLKKKSATKTTKPTTKSESKTTTRTRKTPVRKEEKSEIDLEQEIRQRIESLKKE